MVNLFESHAPLRYFRECIEEYGFIPLLGCPCGCSSEGAKAANAGEHFEFLGALNASNERMHGFRGMVEMRYRKGNSSARPYWMMLEIVTDNSADPSVFMMISHDEIVAVQGRNLKPLIRQVAEDSNTVVIAPDLCTQRASRAVVTFG